MGNSLEVISLIRLADYIGARVTDVATPKVHSATSYHYAAGTDGIGLAVDLAEMRGPSRLTPGLARIAQDVARLIGPSCAELIYAAGPTLKNGKPYRYSASILRAHENHVHVAVSRGFRFSPPAPPAPKENKIVVNAAPVAVLMHPTWGSGYTVVMADGGVATFGGAPFFGSLGGVQLASPIIAAAVTPSGQGYKLLARDGGDFNFGDAVHSGRVEYSGS